MTSPSLLKRIIIIAATAGVLGGCGESTRVTWSAKEEVIDKEIVEVLIREKTAREGFTFTHSVKTYPGGRGDSGWDTVFALDFKEVRRGKVFQVEKANVKVTEKSHNPGNVAEFLLGTAVSAGVGLIVLFDSDGRDKALGSGREQIIFLEKQGIIGETTRFETAEYPVPNAKYRVYIGNNWVRSGDTDAKGYASFPLKLLTPILSSPADQDIVVKLVVRDSDGDETGTVEVFQIPRSSVEPQLAEMDRKREAADEAERQRLEAVRRAEEERTRLVAARRAEEERNRLEAARHAEEERQRREAARLAQQRPVAISSGSGFTVSGSGHVLTNKHVIDGCETITVHPKSGPTLARVLATDDTNDLALLKATFDDQAALPLSSTNASLLESVYVAGYPYQLVNILSRNVKFTRGIVSSLAGTRNNYAQFQIDAAVQPGNSGGPIVNQQGNVIGVTVSGLNKGLFLKNRGTIPENINFGIKSSVARTFLEANGVTPLAPKTRPIAVPVLAESLDRSTHLILCWVSRAQADKMASDQKRELSVSPTMLRQVEALKSPQN